MTAALFKTAEPMAIGPRPARFAAKPEARLKRQLGWLMGVRLVVVTSVIVPYFLARISSPGEQLVYDYLFQGAGAVYLASLAYLAMHVLRRPSATAQAFIQFIGDLLFITGLVYYSGGTTSPFSILYLIVITVASVLLRRRTGVIVATVAWLLYASTVLALSFGWIESPEPERALSVAWLTYSLVVHGLAFYAIALLTSHLASHVARAEQALEQKRELLADLEVAHHDVLESIPSGLLTTDPEGRILSANAAAHEILDGSGRGLIGTSIVDVGLFSDSSWTQVKRYATTASRERLEAEFTTDDGSMPIGYSISQLTRADGTTAGYIVIFQDLSAWRRLQEELRLKDRMVAVGGMASGLAHEIGNPLAAISGSVQMLSASMPEESSGRKLLEIILKESQRLDRTIKGFLRFARPRDGDKVSFEMGPLLQENVELLRNSHEVADHHHIQLELDESAASLVGDPDQITQIFWNLARNALRAMSSGGTLRIVGDVDGPVYRLRFIDSGRGMQEEERANLFHPFRSFFDSGTGIGMAIVYRIVQEHGGQIHVDSQLGRGTTITVELPTVETASRSTSAEAR